MYQELKRVHEWNIADTVTAMRIGASFLLLFLTLDTIWFLVVYTFAGLTDVLDGWVARKTGSISEFGAKLDSIADLLFYGILLIRLFPVLYQTLPPSSSLQQSTLLLPTKPSVTFSRINSTV